MICCFEARINQSKPHSNVDKAVSETPLCDLNQNKKVQVGKDQEKAQSEKDSHSKNQDGKQPN